MSTRTGHFTSDENDTNLIYTVLYLYSTLQFETTVQVFICSILFEFIENANEKLIEIEIQFLYKVIEFY